ncbi:hypothetical protein BKA81DRAFT_353358 [Phyllosticta paracitricarpa]
MQSEVGGRLAEISRQHPERKQPCIADCSTGPPVICDDRGGSNGLMETNGRSVGSARQSGETQGGR